jgi:DNA-directed RNA polymerase specialized sigma24 family protein
MSGQRRATARPAVEAETFEAFYLREYHAVVRLAYALSGSRLVAEDIAQDAFLRAFGDWERIQHPSAWVRKLTVRRAGRAVHRAVRHARGPERVAGPVTAAPARVVARVPVPGTPVAVAVGHGAVWAVAADATRWSGSTWPAAGSRPGSRSPSARPGWP